MTTVFVVGYFWSKAALRTFLSANIGANVTYVALVPPLRDIVYDSAGGMLALVNATKNVPWFPNIEMSPHFQGGGLSRTEGGASSEHPGDTLRWDLGAGLR